MKTSNEQSKSMSLSELYDTLVHTISHVNWQTVDGAEFDPQPEERVRCVVFNMFNCFGLEDVHGRGYIVYFSGKLANMDDWHWTDTTTFLGKAVSAEEAIEFVQMVNAYLELKEL